MFCVFNLIVKNDFRFGTFCGDYLVFEQPYRYDKQQVSDAKFEIAHRQGQTIDDRDSDDNEKIRHLAYFQRLRSVSYHSEDCEESQGKAYRHLHVVHLDDEQENRHCEEHEGEIIVVSAAFRIVKTSHDDPADDEMEGETHQKRPQTGHVVERHAKKSCLKLRLAEFAGDIRIKGLL